MSGNDGIVVQPRDLYLLREISVMRVIDRNQAMLVGSFHSLTRVNTCLLALTRAGLLRRFFLGSGGGRKAIYALSRKGAELVCVPYRGPRRPQGALLAADNFVQHQLTVNDIYCTLKYRPIPLPHVTFREWRAFFQPVVPSLALIPDGYVEFVVNSRIVPCFLEIDLGNESLGIWKEKAENYVALSESEELLEELEQGEFGVLVLVNSERRLHSIRKAVADVTESVFRFATLESVRDDFFGSIWSRPTDGTTKPLFETTP